MVTGTLVGDHYAVGCRTQQMLGIVLTAEVTNILEHRIVASHQPQPPGIRLAIVLMHGLIDIDDRCLLDMLFQRLMDWDHQVGGLQRT